MLSNGSDVVVGVDGNLYGIQSWAPFETCEIFLLLGDYVLGHESSKVNVRFAFWP